MRGATARPYAVVYNYPIDTETAGAQPVAAAPSLTPPQPRRRLPAVAADSLAHAPRPRCGLGGTRHRIDYLCQLAVSLA
jgi:hypothetical protein